MTKLVFHIQIGDSVVGESKELEIRNQPLAHESKRILDAIAKALSELRQAKRPKRGASLKI